MVDGSMGVITSRFFNSPGQEKQFEGDDITGLSGNDKSIITKTFNIVNQDTAKNGERLFLIFFSKYPQHQNYFRDFKNKTLEELEGRPKLIAHGTSVMGSFDTIVLSLDNPDVLVELLLKIGYNHGRHKINPSALKDLKVAILELFTEVLQDELTDEVAEVWDRALDVILNTVGQGIENFNTDH